MRTRRRSVSESERGAVLIHTAIALLGLLAFGTFVVDYGVMWAGRGQAQTSADAAALSGAMALAFDSSTDLAGARTKAQAVARANNVFGRMPDVQAGDITFPPCPPGAPGLPDTCVKVDVYRTQARGNPLPLFFGSLVGVSSQGVRATATAQVVTANATDCLKPWAIVDRWDEYNFPAHPEHNYPNPDPDFGPTSTYDKYSDGKGKNPPPEDDYYVPPSQSAPGTGFKLPADDGMRFAIKADGASTVSSGWFMELRLPRADGHWAGGNVYEENIETCGGLTYAIAAPGTVCPASIGQGDAAYWAERGCFAVKTGGTVGPTRAGIDALITRDPGATYVPGTGIVGSTYSPATRSPRVVPVATMDIDDYLARNPTGGTGTVRLANVYGYFIEGMGDVNPVTGAMTMNPAGKAILGRILTIPGLGLTASPITSTASFLRTVILVR